MKNLIRFVVLTAGIFFTVQSAQSEEYTSAYTKLNYDKHCKTLEEYELGVSAKCTGYKDYPVYFSEGDLRQMVRFGHANPKSKRWQSFGGFNNVGETIEWRLSSGTPIATILRWYIDSGEEGVSESQILVVSTIATHDNPENACIAGYIDARANKNANILARKIADTLALNFNCAVDKPVYHGERGKFSGHPTLWAD